MNVRFEYLYRDAGNNKKWGEIIFSNTKDLDIKSIKEIIGSYFIDELYFDANDIRVAELHFEAYDSSLDHDWHEFKDCTATDNSINDIYNRDISEFIDEIQASINS